MPDTGITPTPEPFDSLGVVAKAALSAADLREENASLRTRLAEQQKYIEELEARLRD